MWRRILASLEQWKADSSRKPLVLRGVRQCGKTFILQEFAKESFKSYVYLNLERNGSACRIFEADHDPVRILREISMLSRVPIDQDTLVILDEVQACPRALTSLKYFCEEMRGQPIACAGSLLGVAVSRDGTFPVGKVDILDMGPMDFGEFLVAMGEGMIFEHLTSSIGDGIPSSFEELLSQHIRDYMMVGGMPEAVLSWSQNRSMDDVIRIQENILDSYEGDFAKHVPASEISRVRDVWRSVPQQLAKDNRKFMFGQVRSGGRARELADALGWLVDAGLVMKSELVESPKYPLALCSDSSVFKVYMSDVGLLGRKCGVDPAVYYADEISDNMKGMLGESMVAMQLSIDRRKLRYWKHGTWEVDFLIEYHGSVVPIEVKWGSRIRAPSLKNYIDIERPVAAVVVSTEPLKFGKVTHVPYYALWMIDSVLDATLQHREAARCMEISLDGRGLCD